MFFLIGDFLRCSIQHKTSWPPSSMGMGNMLIKARHIFTMASQRINKTKDLRLRIAKLCFASPIGPLNTLRPKLPVVNL